MLLGVERIIREVEGVVRRLLAVSTRRRDADTLIEESCKNHGASQVELESGSGPGNLPASAERMEKECRKSLAQPGALSDQVISHGCY